MTERYSSLVKPHATDVLDSQEPLWRERRWECELCKLVDRTSGFAELIAEYPRAMFSAIAVEQKVLPSIC